ncbi:mitochondrial 54S ribosomal protein mL44, partial [Phyllosticta citriasiana]
GILLRFSRLALAVKSAAAIPTSTEPMTAVLVFQFLGCPYQPPAGDQTCLGCPFLQLHQPQAVPQFRRIPLARLQSTVPAPEQESASSSEAPVHRNPLIDPEDYPSPPWTAARKSAKLAALHARLAIPERVPLETMARTLVDPSADKNPDFNNASLSSLGEDLMGYYVSEHIICRYPRLPTAVLMATQEAYVGPDALRAITAEWGVESAAAPGGEVDPGYLQFKRLDPGTEFSDYHVGTSRPNEQKGQGWRRSQTSKIVYDDQFGGLRGKRKLAEGGARSTGVAHDMACSGFVRAVVGAVYVHAGRKAARDFVHSHFLSRQLDVATLFDFRTPTRDLSKLCAREGFESPVARLLGETGRGSRTPVFVVGVFSGPDKLGEDYGASLDEAKIRATASALKSWYLYSPVEYTKPSDVEDGLSKKKWLPNHIDAGEVVV